MPSTPLSAIVALSVLSLGSASVDFSRKGMGVQHLKHAEQQLKLKQPTDCENVEEFRFKGAVIDNFAPINEQKLWEGEGQRYWLNKEFWGGPGSPVFVNIGGEGQESCSRLTSRMYMYELAKENNALLVNVEHRFYGQSYPTLDMTTANLKYLSSEQGLADLARVITQVKTDLHTENSKVITIGGSYPGNMAAWFKLKYPAVSTGSIASSAPLTAKGNFFEYMEVVADAIDYFSGPECFRQFTEAAEVVAELASRGVGSSGFSKLDSDFATCSPMASTKDLGILMSDLMGNVQGTVQYNNEKNGVANVTDICNVMTDDKSGETAYDRFVTLSAQYRDYYGQTCEDASWADSVAYLGNPTYDPSNNMRPWTYQTCNEFGYFQTTDSPRQPWHSWTQLNMDFYMDLCYEGFDGWTASPQTSWMNVDYGSLAISATDVIFPAGTIDPWHALGVTNSTTLAQDTEHALYMLGTAHCADLYAPANDDPASLVSARQTIAAQVAAWVH